MSTIAVDNTESTLYIYAAPMAAKRHIYIPEVAGCNGLCGGSSTRVLYFILGNKRTVYKKILVFYKEKRLW